MDVDTNAHHASKANKGYLRAQFAIYPLELIRTRLAVCPSGHYRGIVHCFTRVLQEEGHRAFYRGLTPSLVRAVLGLGYS